MTTPRDDDLTRPIPAGDPATSPPAVPSPVSGPLDTTPPPPPPPQQHQHRPRPTRTSGTWVAVVTAIFVLVFLLVFILQNLAGATVNFLGGSATLPLGVALLFAAIAGAAVVALVGAARILQLRREAKRLPKG